MRKKVGVGAIDARIATKEKFQQKRQEMQDIEIGLLLSQLEIFKSHLEKFSSQYSNEIKKKPELRKYFTYLCSKIGVDPLASSKGLWSTVLGIGDFYYELAVQTAEIGMALREKTGGLILLTELLQEVTNSRNYMSQKIEEDDILQAINKLKILGSGFKVVTICNQKFVTISPMEMNKDHSKIIEISKDLGYVNYSIIQSKLAWSSPRIKQALDFLVSESVVWIDMVSKVQDTWNYWPVILFQDSRKSDSRI